MTNERAYKVFKIENGTVIDHIKSPLALKIIEILKLQQNDGILSIGMNFDSKRIGKKDIIKVENISLSKKETDLIVGIKHDTWYGVQQELGDLNQPKRAILRDTTYDNIDEIMKIEGHYLSAIEEENEALALIDEAEEIGNDEDE